MKHFKSHIIHLAEKYLRFVFKGMTALFILFTVHPVFTEPVWSGNAFVDISEFVNFVEDIPLAGASNSFTRNTVVEVTNPQNGKTIEITIVKRAPKPGVFLVISEAAGDALDFPADQVLPVQVRVVNDTDTSGYDSRFTSSDPDINPAINLPEEEPASALVPPDPVLEEESVEVVSEEAIEGNEHEMSLEISDLPPEADSFLDEPVPVPFPDETGDILVLAEETVPEEDAVVLEPAELEPVSPVAVPEETIPETDDRDNVIYFLTPSDFRPPEAPAISSEEEIIPVYVERDVLEDKIADQLSRGSSYIQLGAYTSADLVYSEMESVASHYPMIVWTDGSGKDTIYKLLIGPLTPDETGVLFYRFKSNGYADLFLYRP